MAQVISVEKKPSKPTLSKNNKPQRAPLFRKTNYILMAAGVIILVIGYLCLRGGGSENPAEFSDAIFNTQRMIVAPVMMALGLVIELFAIMWYPKAKKDSDQTEQK